jgi:uncharacterized membrane protein HdeD (DUF308 family)
LIRTLIKNWWLLVLCGVLDAIISVIYAVMYDTGPDGPLTPHEWRVAAVFLSRIALAAGVCTIAAGILSFGRGKSWLLVLNGLAFSAYGLIPLFWRGPLNFVLFARLLVLMAISIGILELVTARTLRRQRRVADGWVLSLAGAASLGFALVFLALVFGWIQLERRPFHPSLFLWQALYFGFNAICMLWLGLRLGPFQSGQWEALPLIGNPRHAH